MDTAGLEAAVAQRWNVGKSQASSAVCVRHSSVTSYTAVAAADE